MVSNHDPKTINDFGEEWERFDQSKLSEIEALLFLINISLFFIVKSFPKMLLVLILGAEVVGGLLLYLLSLQN